MTSSWIIAIISFLFLSIANSSESANEAIISPEGDILPVTDNNDDNNNYGVDISWPMQHHRMKGPFIDRRLVYERYMHGCKKQAETCQDYETDRIEMNLLQPSAMQNYTHAGYAKVPTPPVIQDLLANVWNNHQQEKTPELWERGNTYVNHWESPTYMLDLNNHLVQSQQWKLVKEVQSVLEAWTQQSLVLTSVYGIRVYKQGSVLAPHVDRLPLVTSAIINVAQDVDEPWVLEVIGHDGKAHNITMEPGQMVLYESHSVIHGRPFPLKGNYYANVFLHFEPLGHTLRHSSQEGAYGTTSTDNVNVPDLAKEAYERALQMEQMKDQAVAAPPVGQQQQPKSSTRVKSPELPPYVPEDKKVQWRQQYDFEKEHKVSPKPTKQTLGTITVHHAAADGLLDVLKEIAAKERSQLFKADQNGWRPLHEGARGGNPDVVEYLLKEGAQINERTNHGEGGNALWWAEKGAVTLSKRYKLCVEILKKYGGVSLPPKKKPKLVLPKR